MSKYILIAFLFVSLAACQPDPRNQAEAVGIELQAQEDALDQAAARAQAEQKAALELQEAQALAGDRIAAGRRLIYAGSLAACAALAAVAVGVSWGAIGSGRAMARAAAVRANLISLAENTRQYPLFLQYIGHGRYTLANPNTNSITQLDTRKEPDRQLITACAAVQLGGVLAMEARRSNDPAGVAMVRPELITIGESSHEK